MHDSVSIPNDSFLNDSASSPNDSFPNGFAWIVRQFP
jgi:hypothetical protein